MIDEKIQLTELAYVIIVRQCGLLPVKRNARLHSMDILYIKLFADNIVLIILDGNSEICAHMISDPLYKIVHRTYVRW